MKKKAPKITLVFFILTLLFFALAVYNLIEAILYINSYLTAYGVTLSSMFSSAVSYVIGQCLPYFAYAVIVLGITVIMKNVIKNREVPVKPSKKAAKTETPAVEATPVQFEAATPSLNETAEEVKEETEA